MIRSIIRESTNVFISLQGKMHCLDICDIAYIEHSNRAVLFYTLKGVICIPYISLAGIYQLLGSDYFFQCHKSYLVNRLYVERVDRTANSIDLKNEMGTVPLGRKYKKEVLRRLHYIP